jgi:hypothetical protein
VLSGPDPRVPFLHDPAEVGTDPAYAARPMATVFVTAIKASEVPVGGIAAAHLRDTRIVIANVDGTYYAFDDVRLSPKPKSV